MAMIKKVKLPEVIERLRKYWNSDRYIPLDPITGIGKYVERTIAAQKAGKTKTDAELDHLYRWIIVKKGLRTPRTAEGNAYFSRWKKWFDENMWPLLREYARTSFGLYDFYMDLGADSDGTIMFDYDAWTGNVASACLLACGLTHDIDGNVIPIADDDPISSYIEASGCFKFMQYRPEKAQEAVIRMKLANPGRKIRVGLFGGGADPTSWLNNFDLSEIELVIYDTNPKMKAVLEQILGQSLESLGIVYETRDFFEAFRDETLYGTFDIIIYNGVMSYYPDESKKLEILVGTWNLLRVGGQICFEDIISGVDMAFAWYVRCWKGTGIVPEKDLDTAVEKNQRLLMKAKFAGYQYDYLEVNGAPIDLMNYATKAVA